MTPIARPTILARARTEAARAAADAAREARESEVARLAALFLALRVERRERAERDLDDRAVGLARVLAERLLGEALEADPARVVALARQALLEARGAKRASSKRPPSTPRLFRSHVLDIGLAEGALDQVEPSSSARLSPRTHEPRKPGCPAHPTARATRQSPPRRPRLRRTARLRPCRSPVHTRQPARARRPSRLSRGEGTRGCFLATVVSVFITGAQSDKGFLSHESVVSGAQFHGRAPVDPARARVRPLHRGTHPQGGRIAPVLHPHAPPVTVRNDGRRHPHARRHPDAKGAPRHRSVRTSGGALPRDPRLLPGASRTRVWCRWMDRPGASSSASRSSRSSSIAHSRGPYRTG